MKKIFIALTFALVSFAFSQTESFLPYGTFPVSNYPPQSQVIGIVVHISDCTMADTDIHAETQYDFIKKLGKDGKICAVFGHNWVHPIGYQTGDKYYFNESDPYNRQCSVCGQKQHLEIIQTHKEEWVVIP